MDANRGQGKERNEGEKEKEVTRTKSPKRMEKEDPAKENMRKVRNRNVTRSEKLNEEIEKKRMEEKEKEDLPREPEKEIKKKKKGMMKIRKWFGDESSGEEISSDESTDEDNWDTVTCRRQNKEKKKKRKAAKDRLEEITFEKTNHILGVGPISDEKLTGFHKANKNYSEAKIEPVKDFLKERLRFDDDKLSEMNISNTVVSAKCDGVVYAAFEDKGDIHEIRVRTAECREDDIILRNYIPPQIYERYMFVNRICQKMRDKDDSLRTQVRFGVHDVEVMIKTKGSRDPYRIKPLDELTDLRDIPKFDHSKVWSTRVDRPPRRKVFNSPERTGEAVHPTTAKRTTPPPSRISSMETNPTKKQRKDGATEEQVEMEEDPLEISLNRTESLNRSI